MKGFAAVLSCSIAFLLAGCSASVSNSTGSSGAVPVSAGTAGASGTVYGGSQAIANASIQLWTVGTTANASGATGLLATGSYTASGVSGCVPSSSQVCYPTSVTTTSSGSFSLASAFNCSSAPNQLVYLTATGGNPGLASGTNNTAIQLVTAVGPCSNLTSGSHWVLNEATTLASVYGLNGYISFTGSVGSTPANASSLSTAFTAANNLVNPNTGNPRLVTPDGTQVVPQAELDTLANLLAICVNSTGSTASGQPCASLFAAVAGTAPTNVQQVAYDIANNPSSNVTGLFNLAPTNGPFQPTLSAAPANWTVTLTPVTTLSIMTTNIASATVGVNYNQTFTATGGSGSYTWAIPSGSQLTALNNDGLGYGSSGSLNGTPTAPGSFPFTMQVTDLGTGQTASAPYTLIVNNAVLSQCTHDGSGNAILNGHYAFLLGGFDPNGHYYDQIGSFKADGAGNITNGLGDANGDNQLSQFASGEQQYTFSGTYSIGSTDDRGIITVNTSNSSTTSIFCIAADTVTGGVASSGRVIEADGNGYIQTGVFAIQNTSNFSAAALSGGYAFGVQGVDTPPNRRASVGQFTLNGSGGVSGGQLDFASANNNGSSEGYTAGAAILNTSSYTMGSGGRGTLTINVSGNSLTFVTYEFGNNQLFMLSSNDTNNPLLLGQATPQTLTTFTTANIAGRGVFRSDGSPGAVADDMQVGVLTYDGAGNATAVIDENNAGTITTPASVLTANYVVTSLGYLTLPGAGNHPVNFYLYAPGGGYGISTSNEVDFWTMAPQTLPNGGFTSSSLSGAYALGTIPSASYSTSGAGTSNHSSYPSVQVGEVTLNAGAVSLTDDTDQPPGTVPYVSTGQTVSTTLALDSTYGATYGRFNVSGGPVGYIVSPSQVVLLQETSGKNGTLEILDHQ